VTSNVVTICGSKFPPTVSKYCQHQHSAIPEHIQAIWYANIPSCCDIQGAASSVQHHGSLCHSNSRHFFDVSSCLPKYNNNTTKLTFNSVQSLPAEPLTILPKMSTYQHTAVHFNLSLPHRNVVITLFNCVTNYYYWIVAEWYSRCRFSLVFEMVYWRRIGIIVVILIIFLELRIN